MTKTKLILSPCACAVTAIRVGISTDHKLVRDTVQDFIRRNRIAKRAAGDHSRPMKERYFSVHWRGKHVVGLRRG